MLRAEHQTLIGEISLFGVDMVVTLHRNSCFRSAKEENMNRAIAIAFILAFASSTQAMPVQPQQQPDEMVTLVR